MIIRIATEGQYELAGEALNELDRQDDYLLDALAAGDSQGFVDRFHKVLSLIRERGRKLSDTELAESELILPAPDTTFEQAKKLFTAYPRKLH